MWPSRLALLALGALAALPAGAAAPGRVTVVACAPGFPGTTAEAQPYMDALASALARGARLAPGAVGAIYLPREAEGVDRLRARDAAIALVTLPFYLRHGAALGLTPRLQVEVTGSGLLERWALVAKKGRVSRATDLTGMTVLSTAGYAAAFVRGALVPWGRIADAVDVAATSQVLSALRKAAAGADVAVLLDGAQADALPTLPFAGELEIVARSAPLPTALVATVDAHLAAAHRAPFERALLALARDPDGAAALAGIRMVRFAPLDAAALAAGRATVAGGAR